MQIVCAWLLIPKAMETTCKWGTEEHCGHEVDTLLLYGCVMP